MQPAASQSENDRFDSVLASLRHVPRQARGIATVRLILETAENLIERGRIDTFTLGDVAKAAGLSIGVLYRYFPDRIALLDALRPERYADHDRALRAELERDMALAALTRMKDIAQQTSPDWTEFWEVATIPSRHLEARLRNQEAKVWEQAARALDRNPKRSAREHANDFLIRANQLRITD